MVLSRSEWSTIDSVCERSFLNAKSGPHGSRDFDRSDGVNSEGSLSGVRLFRGWNRSCQGWAGLGAARGGPETVRGALEAVPGGQTARGGGIWEKKLSGAKRNRLHFHEGAGG